MVTVLLGTRILRVLVPLVVLVGGCWVVVVRGGRVLLRVLLVVRVVRRG